MFESWKCPGANHVAPETGGSCPCGMVTVIPAPAPALSDGPAADVLALLAQCLDGGSTALTAASQGLLRERADRLVAALATAGLVLSSGMPDRMAA